MKKKIVWIGLVLVIVLITIGFYFYNGASAENSQTEEVKKVTAIKQDVRIAISADAKATNSLVNLKFGVSGTIKEISVFEGQKVKEGDILASLNTKNLQQQFEQAKSNYNTSVYKLNKLKNGAGAADVSIKQAAVDSAKSAVADVQATYDNALMLYNSGLLPEQIAVSNAQTSVTDQQAIYDYNVSTFGAGSQQVLQAKQNMDEAKSKLASAQATLATRNGVSTEVAKLNAAKGQLSATEAQLNAIGFIDENDVRVAEEAVKQAKAALTLAENNLNDATLKAPADGVILSINNVVGELTSTSSVSTQTSGSDGVSSSAFIVMATNDKINVEASVLEDDLDKIKIGQQAEVTFNATQGENFNGAVSSISPNPTVDQSGIVTYKIDVIIDNNEDEIKNGMTASVSFIIQKASNVITIPNSVVKRINGTPAVEVEKKDGTTTWQKVKTGITDGTYVEIREGLKVGDKVIIRKEANK